MSDYLGLLLSRGKYEKAAEVNRVSYMAYLLAGDRERTIDEATSVRNDPETSLLNVVWSNYAAYLCGERQEARKAWDRIWQDDRVVKPNWIRNVLRAFRGDDPRLIEQEVADSIHWTAHAHFCIGAAELSKRVAAREPSSTLRSAATPIILRRILIIGRRLSY